MENEKFPDTIEEVIYQEGQFACVPNNSYNSVAITDFTEENVVDACISYAKDEEDAEGALYFTRGSFDRTYLFTDSVQHNFFK